MSCRLALAARPSDFLPRSLQASEPGSRARQSVGVQFLCCCQPCAQAECVLQAMALFSQTVARSSRRGSAW